ncbi:MAG: methicillin resistance protein [candidate division WS6 bacterium GW2011_GWC1_33_20]|uniref:Methicillin resistance protein n=2 Tax=Candidatus Dojkabacteria TaxID=74243 RepID=A0A0G0AVT2_9BACT|nr:MAG: methicillin resistance protein [candidate division WS6 bacterium GW2011_GWE2_33_157]KKP44387.1 MAG: methicillin resistance protein [candidate division WS6 bacterium GW2011_GWC1_33_20]KKP46017.1 MAG: methicillin resistance protein [candidate division WS6 bacterium GW2011_GWF1_33_233]KKP55471.1 MAG: Methicillin resistance protein [candidate division WS6 bacterium GW2011_GWB1_33_6]KKP55551.1 MAG: methicillin resistance protein [candidate division WS6 bacterium GW2011_WS6_33_547]KKP56885.1
MDIQVREITEQKIWDEFVKLSPNCSFMQSWNWSLYQEIGLGHKTFRLGFFDEENLIAVSACYEMEQTFGKYIYCSRGPILKSLDTEIYKKVLESLKSFFAGKEYIFLKIDPAIEQQNRVSILPFDLGFKKCINYVQPETPWFIELVGNSEEELMDWCEAHGMGKNYPTYIRKARKLGVTIRFSKDLPDWKVFTHYLAKSSDQKDFAIRGADYYLKQLKYLGEYDEVRLAIAQYSGEPIAMLVLSFFGNEVACLYSCQTGIQNKVRGPMLLRWECMLQAQREGFKYFNSWDVLPDEKYTPRSKRYGYSNFKRGFGGYLVRYQRTVDYPFNTLKYFFVRLLDIYRRVRFYSDR